MVGRHLPTAAEPNPTVFRMKVWAPDAVCAKSKFWYFLRKLRRVKKANGQIIAVNEVRRDASGCDAAGEGNVLFCWLGQHTAVRCIKRAAAAAAALGAVIACADGGCFARRGRRQRTPHSRTRPSLTSPTLLTTTTPPSYSYQIFERKTTTVKNYGIWVRYQSRTGYHNM